MHMGEVCVQLDCGVTPLDPACVLYPGRIWLTKHDQKSQTSPLPDSRLSRALPHIRYRQGTEQSTFHCAQETLAQERSTSS